MYYVYAHVDPATEELLYIGKGKNGRAWEIDGRKPGHLEYLEQFVKDNGRGSYVRIICDHMDSDDAYRMEGTLIAMNQPAWNAMRPMPQDDDALDYKELKAEYEILWKPPVF